MNKENLQKQIEEMKTKLADMEAELNKPEVVTNYWQPSKGDKYYYVNMLGYVESCNCFKDSKQDEIRHRVFKTREEAEKYAEYIKAEETLRRVIAEANEGWLPNWNSSDEYKFEVQLINRDARLYVDCFSSLKRHPNFMYIKSKELAEKLMKEYEAEFTTYLYY